jgi:hypothetical protein
MKILVVLILSLLGNSCQFSAKVSKEKALMSKPLPIHDGVLKKNNYLNNPKIDHFLHWRQHFFNLTQSGVGLWRYPSSVSFGLSPWFETDQGELYLAWVAKKSEAKALSLKNRVSIAEINYLNISGMDIEQQHSEWNRSVVHGSVVLTFNTKEQDLKGETQGLPKGNQKKPQNKKEIKKEQWLELEVAHVLPVRFAVLLKSNHIISFG